MDRFRPVGRRQFLRVLSAMLQVLNQIQQQIHRAVLSGWPVLIHDRVNGDGIVNARQFMPGLVLLKRLNDCDGAVLTIIGISVPPNHAEDLAGTEVVHAAPLPFFMVIGRRTKTQANELRSGNVASDKTG
jgi:hypothetical protein